jgi:SAM-dependent methyltransferase
MGIPIQSAALLAEEHRRRPFRGRLLQLGRQTVLFDRQALRRFAGGHGLSVPPASGPDDALATDVELFTALGFDRVESCDVSDYQKPDHILDLNADPGQLGALAGRFDCVLDGGTVEHVFDVRRAFLNIVRLLAVGGRVIHCVVSSNNPDHGFYMFSPTLFEDYYTANGFTVDSHVVFEFTVNHNFNFFDPYYLYRYTPGCLDHLSHKGLGRRPMGIFFVATKSAETTGEVIPTQRIFQPIWSGEAPPAGPRSRLGRWKDAFRDRFPRLYVRAVDGYRALRPGKPRCVGTIRADGVIRWR